MTVALCTPGCSHRSLGRGFPQRQIEEPQRQSSQLAEDTALPGGYTATLWETQLWSSHSSDTG